MVLLMNKFLQIYRYIDIIKRININITNKAKIIRRVWNKGAAPLNYDSRGKKHKHM